jgi:hypothetical protein
MVPMHGGQPICLVRPSSHTGPDAAPIPCATESEGVTMPVAGRESGTRVNTLPDQDRGPSHGSAPGPNEIERVAEAHSDGETFQPSMWLAGRRRSTVARAAGPGSDGPEPHRPSTDEFGPEPESGPFGGAGGGP